MRRALGFGLGLAACINVVGASAQTWSAVSQLDKDRSPVNCPQPEAGSKLSFTISGSRLTMTSGTQKVDVAIATDGTVKQEIRSANGARGLLTGQTSTKTLEFQNLNSGCRYTYVVN